MKNISNPKVLVFHPNPIQKQGVYSISHYLYALFMVSIICLLLLFLGVLSSKQLMSAPPVASSSSADQHPLPYFVVDALLHYASASNVTVQMPAADLRVIVDVLRRCRASCNLLVFGLGHESLLWKALNPRGRTVFLEENEYFAAWFEAKYPHLEAYDLRYTTAIAQMPELLREAQDRIRADCRPVQNLLFSDCVLAINDLPNHLYEVGWDVILVDGPRGRGPKAPGRMSAIFTASVLARSKRDGEATHVLVHDFEGEVERICGERFLCKENMVRATNSLAHFVVERMDPSVYEFCTNQTRTMTKET